MFEFSAAPTRRRAGLTPMIDVVFLLLVFFMLISRFGVETALPLALGTGGAAYDGPPRLVDVAPEGLRLNGVAMPAREVLTGLVGLTESGDDVIVLRPVEGATLGRLVEVTELFGAAGFGNLAIVEAP